MPATNFPDPRIQRACTFCGEREHLTIDDDGMERVAIRDGQVVEFVWKGHQLLNAEYVPMITCQVCDSMAALDVWNRTRTWQEYAVLRDFDPPASDDDASEPPAGPGLDIIFNDPAFEQARAA